MWDLLHACAPHASTFHGVCMAQAALTRACRQSIAAPQTAVTTCQTAHMIRVPMVSHGKQGDWHTGMMANLEQR